MYKMFFSGSIGFNGALNDKGLYWVDEYIVLIPKYCRLLLNFSSKDGVKRC